MHLAGRAKGNHDGRQQTGMVQTQQVPDLMRQDALNVEFPRLAASRVLQQRAEDNVGFVRKDFAPCTR